MRIAKNPSFRALVVVGIFACFSAIFAIPAQAVPLRIRGSQHDFSSKSWSGGEICKVCHTPHNADIGIVEAPLWNHQTTTATYQLYESSTLLSHTEQPRGPSKICLSCHDGTVAVDSFGGNTGSTQISGNAMIGTDLRDDHPVSIHWKHKPGPWGPNTPSCLSCHNLGGSIAVVAPLPFPGGYVECSTCHDVHGTEANYPHLLRMWNDRSSLCLYCHWK